MSSTTELKKLAAQRREQAIQWYQSREPREQRILQVLAVVTFVVLVYWLIWAPSVAARDQAQRQFVSNQQTLQWIEDNRAAVIAARRGDSSSAQPAGNWIGNVSRSADQFGLTLKNFSPDGNRAVRIQMENQVVSQTMLWLQSLQQTGAQLSNLEMTPGEKPGTATVRATLQR
ncbi:type II secretion system protein M [Alcanivorax sp.]|jgi:general secretion pathway protein M|uniref:type II secretion system protein M n=1 Tax=Alcanivorax sp. TaxID=1872427 RepID=UPI0032D99288